MPGSTLTSLVSGFSRTTRSGDAVRFLDLTMSSLFAFAAALQLNDPDPVRWVAIYGAACALSVVAFFRRRVSPGLALAVCIVAMGWSALIALGGPAPSEYGHMFDAWEMKSPSVEEAREASGLLIVAGWMIVLFIRTRRNEVGPW